MNLDMNMSAISGNSSRTIVAQRVNPATTATTLNEAATIAFTAAPLDFELITVFTFAFFESTPLVGPVTYRIQCTGSSASGVYTALTQALVVEEVDGPFDIQNALS